MRKSNTIIESEIFYGASPEIFKRAGELRKNMTEAERKLWSLLRKKQVGGKKFRRQHPVKTFIVDFYCHECKLVVEVDGNIHQLEEQKEYDNERTYELEQLGLKVIRFTNDQVLQQPEMVIARIKETIRMLNEKATKNGLSFQ
jgi:very-short-patch-repair endonuclease